MQWFWYGAGLGICSNGASRTDFSYDGLGRLRRRVEYSATNSAPPPGPPGVPPPDSPDCFWSLGPETDYIYDGSRVIQVRDGNNNLEVSYTLGPDLSGTLEGAGGIGGLLARSDQYSGGNPTRHNYYHADGGGNVTYLVNSSQGLAASYRYDPFGNTISSSGTLAAFNLYRFSSKEVHANSGMYHFLYRFYDPRLQRWLNRDPLGEAGGINLYGFVGNDPVGYIDPYGEWWLDDRIHDISTVVADAMWGEMQGKAPGNSYIAQRGKLLGPTEDVLTPSVAGGTELTLQAGKEIAESYLMGKGIEAAFGMAGLGYGKWIAPALAKARRVSPRVCQAARGPIHHIATNKNLLSTLRGGPWTPRFEAIFKKAGMTLQDAANKVEIPGHFGPHPEAYHQAIFDRLTSATAGLSGSGYAAALRAELNAIASEAQTAGTILNKLLTQK